MTIYEKLVDVQGRLKAPKNQRNNFGKYNYRSCEDILEAVKPLLVEHKLALVALDWPELAPQLHGLNGLVEVLVIAKLLRIDIRRRLA